MNTFPHRPLFRLLSLALIPVLLSACASWQKQYPPLTPHVEKGPDRVRLTLTDGRVLELRDPTLSGDSIVGAVFPDDGSSAFAAGAPLEEIVQLELPRNPGGKVGAGVLIASGLAVGGYLVFLTVKDPFTF